MVASRLTLMLHLHASYKKYLSSIFHFLLRVKAIREVLLSALTAEESDVALDCRLVTL